MGRGGLIGYVCGDDGGGDDGVVVLMGWGGGGRVFKQLWGGGVCVLVV